MSAEEPADAGPPLETPWSSSAEADAAVANYFEDAEGGTCPPGYHYDEKANGCVPDEVDPNPDGSCPEGYQYDAAQNACVWTGGGGGGGGGSPTDIYGESSTIGGRLSVPSPLEQGQAFEASGTVRNDSDTAQEGQFVLAAVGDDGQPVRLDSVSTTVETGASVNVEYTVPQGSLQLPVGDATFAIVAIVTSGSGVVAEDKVEIVAPGDGDDPQEGSEWGEPYFIQELPFGWNLYGEDHKTEEKTRYVVSAKNSAGEVIYLTKAGGISSNKVYFDNVDDIVSALEQYGQRYQNGEFGDDEVPDPSQPRPTPEELMADAPPGGVEGFLSALVGEFGRRGAALALAAGIVLLARFLHAKGRLNTKQRRYATIAAVAGGLGIALDYDWGTVGLGAATVVGGFWAYRRFR